MFTSQLEEQSVRKECVYQALFVLLTCYLAQRIKTVLLGRKYTKWLWNSTKSQNISSCGIATDSCRVPNQAETESEYYCTLWWLRHVSPYRQKPNLLICKLSDSLVQP